MAIIKIRNAAIDLDAAEIPNIDASKITSGSIADARIPSLAASKITSGTFADARIASSNVSQHATSFDDNKIVNDISTLALRQATNENAVAYNTSSQYVDVFQDATGIANLVTCARNASGEFLSSATFSLTGSNVFEGNTDRQSVYTLTDTFASGLGLYSGSGDLAKMIDGSVQANNIPESSSAYLHATGNTATKNTHYMAFDLGSSATKKAFSGLRWQHQANTNQYGGTDAWLIQGSLDNTNWEDVHSFTWTHSSNWDTNITFTPTKSFRAVRITPSSSLTTSTQTWQRQWHWGTRAYTEANNATGSFQSNAITASSSTNKMGAIITYQDQAGTNALNSDIVLQLSADGGSNFTTATLTALPDFSTGIKMAKVNDLAVTAGTSLKYKLSFANQSGSKEARIRGVSLQY